MEFLATTNQGLEQIALDEVKGLIGSEGRKEGEGKIRFEGKEEAIFTLNYCSYSLHKVLILLYSGKFYNLRELYHRIKEIDFQSYIHKTQSFAIRPSRIGEHDYTSMDIGKEAGQAVIDSFKESKGERLKVDLDHPNVEIPVYVKGDKFYVTINTTGESLHKRGYRKYEHPAPIKPSMAYSLLRIAEWNEKESLLDPFCGSGTIPIEAARYANKISNFYRNFSFWKLFFLPREEFLEKIREKNKECEGENKNLEIYGSDISPKHVEAAKENAKEAGVKINFSQGDATKISLGYDKIVTNPPYGLRVEKKSKLGELYQEFYYHLKEENWDKVVLITGSPDLFEKEYSKRLDIMYGNLPSAILIFE